jgi:hypothetical protein
MLNNDVLTYIIAPAILSVYLLTAAEFAYREKSEKKTRMLFFSMGIIAILLETLGAFIVISNCLQ